MRIGEIILAAPVNKVETSTQQVENVVIDNSNISLMRAYRFSQAIDG